VSQKLNLALDVPAPARHITVTRLKSRTLRLEKPFSSAVVGSPDIADVLPMSDRIIYIQGKKVGTTNVSVFDQDKNLISVLDLEVGLDIQNIANRIRAGTESPGIHVTSSNDQIILSGEARSAVDAERAVAIAKSMVTLPEGGQGDPDKYVINAMRVAASQQVMLQVRFIEISRTAERDLAVNLSGNKFTTGLGTITQSPSAAPGGITDTLTSVFPGNTTAVPFAIGLLKTKGISAFVSGLEEKGLARNLAEPDLIALSGDTASFLAGGEFPVPSVQSSSGTVPVITTQYQPFGVQLTFVPTVLANGLINLRLTPSVSSLDYNHTITIGGTLIPSLIKREARTTIELRDGQSFAIAGLLQSDNTTAIAQMPWIGSVPVLGALFRSTSFQQNETDLVVIVTPHLVAPVAPGQALRTPFDDSLPSNDIDLFLMGRPEVRKQYTDYLTSGGQLTGPYGHIMPLAQK
jgi:pilus assembly protein CpaC